jgi:Tfp pilus assembly protein PilF
VQYGRLHKPEAAKKEFERAVELDPFSHVAYGDLARIYLQLGDLNSAERAVERAVALDGTDPRTRFLYGALLVRHPASKSEGVRHLQYASRTMRDARRVLEQVIGDSSGRN